MHLSKLRTVGGSVMFAIPKALLDSLDLSPGGDIGLTVAEGRLILDPHPRPRYTLAELLAECDPTAPMTEETRAWLDAPSAGREEL